MSYNIPRLIREVKKLKKIKCPYCGKKIVNMSGFCPECSNTITELMESQINSNPEISTEGLPFSDFKLNKGGFTTTKKVGKYIEFDETKKLWRIPGGFLSGNKESLNYRYEDVLESELLEDDTTVYKGSLGRTIAGGMAFGFVGALAGSSKRKGKKIINSLKIKITTKDTSNPVVYINLLGKTSSTSFVYQTAYQQAQEILSIFRIILNNNTEIQNIEIQNKDKKPDTYFSSADELAKYKKLLDEGAITQEEYIAVKKRLLGL